MLLFLIILQGVFWGNFGEAQVCNTVKQMVNETQIIWPLTGVSSVSIPPCLKENLEFIKRKCKKGTWEPEPECFQIMKTTEPFCPDGYSWLDPICYVVLEGNFSTNCPLPNELPHFEFADKGITSDPVWYPVKRNDDGIFHGEYYYMEKSHYYGQIFDGVIESHGKIKEKLCVVGDYKTTSKLVNCGESHKKICAYKPIFDSSVGICKIKFPNQDCLQLFSGNTQECFCILEKTNTSRNEFCENLAEFREPYQNQVRKTIGDKHCWFGLEKLDSNYVWSSTKEKIHYAFWGTENTDFSRNFGTIYKNGWFLRADDRTPSTNCGICQKKLTYNTPKMKITSDNYKVFLTVTFGDDLKNFDNDKNHVCFFEAGTKQVQTKMETKELGGDGPNEKIYYFGVAQDGPGFYWCEGFSYPNLLKVVSNKLLVFPDIFGEEFVATVTFGYDTNISNPLEGAFFHHLRNTILEKLDLDYVSNLRKFKSFGMDENERKIQFLVHLTTKNNFGCFYQLRKKLSDVLVEIGGTLNGFYSSNFCPNDTEGFLTWPNTAMGGIAFPKESCAQNDGHVINRKCEGDFLNGAKWGPIRGTCEYEVPISAVTQDLNSLLEGNHTTGTVIEILKNITEKFEEFNYTDVFLVGKILRKISGGGGGDFRKISTVMSNLMEINRKILVQSQLFLNATDEILKTYDDIVRLRRSPKNKPYELTITKNLVCLIADVTNIVGLVLLSKNNTVIFEPITSNTNLEELPQKNFDAAVLINTKLAYQIKKRLIISVYLQDSLFNPSEDTGKTIENVIFGVLFPELPKTEGFKSPLSIYYRRHSPKNFERFCTHWQFSPEGFLYNTKSTWVESGVINHQNTLVKCDFWHVTHFGLLVGTNTNIPNFGILTIITSTNCAISTLGLLVIFMTGILFKTWRVKSSNQILMNFSLAITLQLGAFYFSSVIFGEESNESVCIAVGVVLHYSVLAEFCWMLILGFLQFRRLVVVFVHNTKLTVLGYCAFGWLVPLVPVLLLLGVSPKNYAQNGDLCYPSHFGFYLGVFLPILLISIANFSVFVVITYKICQKGPSECFGGARNDVFAQLRMIILLFFMLGLTWFFGLIAHLGGGAFFLYSFCFLATLQGFILFLFFIVLNKTTRRFYKNLLVTSTFAYSNKN